jgi:hypothetical protein
MPTDTLETCANCDRTIGRMEIPHLFRDTTVCSDCHDHLKRQSAGVQKAAPDSEITRKTNVVAKAAEHRIAIFLLILFLIYAAYCVLNAMMHRDSF